MHTHKYSHNNNKLSFFIGFSAHLFIFYFSGALLCDIIMYIRCYMLHYTYI